MFFAHPIPWWALAAIVLLAAALALPLTRAAASRSAPASRHVDDAAVLHARAARIFLLRPVVPLPRPPAPAASSPCSSTRRAAWASRTVQALRVSLRHRRWSARRSSRALGRVQGGGAERGRRIERADPATFSADARRTDLPGAIAAARDRYRDRNLAGIVVISDGGNLVSIEHASRAPLETTPVITVGVGDPQIRYDREVRSVTAGPSAMDASLVDLTATIVGHGADRPIAGAAAAGESAPRSSRRRAARRRCAGAGRVSRPAGA